jgi:hypothetical protein
MSDWIDDSMDNIEILTSIFQIQFPGPIDTRYLRRTRQELDLISPAVKYHGLTTYISIENKFYVWSRTTSDDPWVGEWKPLSTGFENAAEWGNITGNITTQTDLMDEFNLKYDKTGGDITGNVGIIKSNDSAKLTMSYVKNNVANPITVEYHNTNQGRSFRVTDNNIDWLNLTLNGLSAKAFNQKIFLEDEYVNKYDPNNVSPGAPILLNDRGFVDASLIDDTIAFDDYYKLDGSIAITAPFAGGNQRLTNIADPSVQSDGATKNYVDTNFEKGLGNPAQDDYVLASNTTGNRYWVEMGSGGSSSFIGLADTPTSYSGNANKFTKVAGTADSLVFTTLEISDVEDLNDELSLRPVLTNDSSPTDKKYFTDRGGTGYEGFAVKLNASGLIDGTMLGVQSPFVYVGPWTPAEGTGSGCNPVYGCEYPSNAGYGAGAFWDISNVDATNGYTYKTGPLVGETAYNGDWMVLGENNNWTLLAAGEFDPTLYYKLDGSSSLTADFAGGGYKLSNIADGTEATDAATKGQLDAHTTNLDNPHQVDKADVGLDFIKNDGSGDQYLADDGVYKDVKPGMEEPGDDTFVYGRNYTAANGGVWQEVVPASGTLSASGTIDFNNTILTGLPAPGSDGAAVPLGYLAGNYIREDEFIASSAGDADAGKPIVLNDDGKIDPTMMDITVFHLVGNWDPSAGQEYPTPADFGLVEDFNPGDFCVVTALINPSGSDQIGDYFIFSSGDLTGEKIRVGDFMVWTSAGWSIMPSIMNPLDYLRTDGANTMKADLLMGSDFNNTHRVRFVSAPSEDSDAANKSYVDSLKFTDLADTIDDYSSYPGYAVVVSSDGSKLDVAEMTTTLEKLTDTNIGTLVNNDILVFDDAQDKWINKQVSLTDNYLTAVSTSSTDLSSVTFELKDLSTFDANLGHNHAGEYVLIDGGGNITSGNLVVGNGYVRGVDVTADENMASRGILAAGWNGNNNSALQFNYNHGLEGVLYYDNAEAVIANRLKMDFDASSQGNVVMNSSISYFKSEFVGTESDVGSDVNAPVKLTNGKIDSSLLNFSGLSPKGEFTPAAGAECPVLPPEAQGGWFWIISGVSPDGYTYTSCGLDGTVANNGDWLLLESTDGTNHTWQLMDMSIGDDLYLRLDGSKAMRGTLNMGTQSIVGVKDATSNDSVVPKVTIDNALAGKAAVVHDHTMDQITDYEAPTFDLTDGTTTSEIADGEIVTVTGGSNVTVVLTDSVTASEIKISATDSKVAAGSSDTTPGTLIDKLEATGSVTIGDNGDKLTIDGKDEKVKAYSAATSAGYLNELIVPKYPLRTQTEFGKLFITIEGLEVSDNYSSGVAVLTTDGGKIDPSFLDTSIFYMAGAWTPSDPDGPNDDYSGCLPDGTGNYNCEYPDIAGKSYGAFW